MTLRKNKLLITEYLLEGKLESALDVMNRCRIKLDESDYNRVLEHLEEKVHCERTRGEIRTVNRLNRRINALKTFRDHGLEPVRLISSVDLPGGYHGKILLVYISGGMANGMVCLRSCDDWHREILRNMEEEIRDLGFENSIAVPAGGASVQFDKNRAIIVHGSSDEFGSCDKKMAADLISKAFPGKKVLIRR